jgi:hypothetical protein
MIMVSSVGWRRARYREAGVAVVTAASGYDLGYVWKSQAGPRSRSARRAVTISTRRAVPFPSLPASEGSGRLDEFLGRRLRWPASRARWACGHRIAQIRANLPPGHQDIPVVEIRP